MTEATTPKHVPETGLTRRQKSALRKSPPAEQIRTRREGERELTYLEGWYVIAEANRIFGAEHWNRETLASTCVWQGRLEGSPGCAYTARVRISVRAGAHTFVREGSGFGQSRGESNGEAHGNALKIAETDATKRALATLGAPFGLTLYDPDQAATRASRGVDTAGGSSADKTTGIGTPTGNASRSLSGAPQSTLAGPGTGGAPWIAYGPAGETAGVFRDPVLCCSALRRAIEAAESPSELEAAFAANRRTLARLAAERPDLRSDADQHYAEILSALFQARLKRYSIRNDHKPRMNGPLPQIVAG